jgi:hypothetical protein
MHGPTWIFWANLTSFSLLESRTAADGLVSMLESPWHSAHGQLVDMLNVAIFDKANTWLHITSQVPHATQPNPGSLVSLSSSDMTHHCAQTALNASMVGRTLASMSVLGTSGELVFPAIPCVLNGPTSMATGPGGRAGSTIIGASLTQWDAGCATDSCSLHQPRGGLTRS